VQNLTAIELEGQEIGRVECSLDRVYICFLYISKRTSETLQSPQLFNHSMKFHTSFFIHLALLWASVVQNLSSIQGTVEEKRGGLGGNPPMPGPTYRYFDVQKILLGGKTSQKNPILLLNTCLDMSKHCAKF
jgi:hypothetical protein